MLTEAELDEDERAGIERRIAEVRAEKLAKLRGDGKEAGRHSERSQDKSPKLPNPMVPEDELSDRERKMLVAAREIEAEGGEVNYCAAARRAGLNTGTATTIVRQIQYKNPALWPWRPGKTGRPSKAPTYHAPKPTPRRDSPGLVPAAAPAAAALPRKNGHGGGEQPRTRTPQPRPADQREAGDRAGGEPETATEPELTAVASSVARPTVQSEWIPDLDAELVDDQVVNVAIALKALPPQVRRAVLAFATAWEG